MRDKLKLILSSSPIVGALLVFLLQVAFMLPLLGLGPIGSSTEAREAHVARLMLEKGEWILPLRNGIIPSKPPLYHWAAALLGGVFGDVTPMVARLPSALAAGLIAAVVGLLAFDAAARGPKSNRANPGTAVVLAVLILDSMYGFVTLAFDCRVDMVFSLFVVLSLAALLWRIDLAAGVKALRWNWFFTFCGLAVLAKGPVGLALPGLLATCLCWQFFGGLEILREWFRPRWGWLTFGAIALPWYLLAWQRARGDFLGKQLIFENVRRLTGGEMMNNAEWWYYFPSVLRTTFPWSVLICIVSFRCLHELWRRRALCSKLPFQDFDTLRNGYLIWLWIGILFFSIPSGKRHSYLLPLFPALALAGALSVYGWYICLSDDMQARAQRWVKQALRCWVFFGVLVLIAAALVEVQAWRGLEILQGWLIFHRPLLQIYVSVAVILALVALYFARAPRALLAWLSVYSLFISLSGFGISAKNYLKGFDLRAQELSQLVPATSKLICVIPDREEYFDPLLYYIHRDVVVQQPPALSIKNGDFVLSFTAQYDVLAARAKASGRSVETIKDFTNSLVPKLQSADEAYTLYRVTDQLP